ncbi:Hypothetical predicted protein [Podarcis lilfordi]|uniref:Uncharacterized protein n=1 Tax=Podarcis lilfordi TaxID=74358 RepID=A0AA35P296_9SAUR|nr:Hypothetical predicted protein [Podarcis lilfordi]
MENPGLPYWDKESYNRLNFQGRSLRITNNLLSNLRRKEVDCTQNECGWSYPTEYEIQIDGRNYSWIKNLDEFSTPERKVSLGLRVQSYHDLLILLSSMDRSANRLQSIASWSEIYVTCALSLERSFLDSTQNPSNQDLCTTLQPQLFSWQGMFSFVGRQSEILFSQQHQILSASLRNQQVLQIRATSAAEFSCA